MKISQLKSDLQKKNQMLKGKKKVEFKELNQLSKGILRMQKLLVNTYYIKELEVVMALVKE